MTTKNIYSHLTAKERQYVSFPTRFLHEHNLLVGEIIDYGCGTGKDVEFLLSKSLDVVGYDPYYQPDFIEKKYDTVICNYVLNVLLKEEQTDVLMEVSRLIRPFGKAYFTVRRDIKYEGFRLHKIHLKQTYQTNVQLPYKSIFRNESTEIYEYQHYTFLNKGNLQASPFFNTNEMREMIFESATVFSFYDKYPVTKGHALVVPKRVQADYFQLTFKEQVACWMVVNKVKQELFKKFNPQGFNIGINISSVAGQTIPHVHIHVIPRYMNDCTNPVGGVRNVILEKADYTKSNHQLIKLPI